MLKGHTLTSAAPVNPARRSVLGLFAAMPILAVPALARAAPVNRVEWERVTLAWRAAGAAIERFDVEHYTPAHDALEAVLPPFHKRALAGISPEARPRIDAGWGAFNPVQDRFDALVVARLRASDVVIETTPPDVQAFAEKVEIALIEIEGAEMDEGWYSRLLADALRFAGRSA